MTKEELEKDFEKVKAYIDKFGSYPSFEMAGIPREIANQLIDEAIANNKPIEFKDNEGKIL